VFQAETIAIMEAAKHLLERGLRNANVAFFSDSQAAIKALSSVRQNSTLTTNCKRAPNAVGLNNTVSLIWIPCHWDHAGNEKADELARLGSEMTTTPEEVRPPLNSIKHEIHKLHANKANVRWKTHDGCRRANNNGSERHTESATN